MQHLAEVTASSAKQKPPYINAMIIDPEKPDSVTGQDENDSDATANKAVSDWIAKARQSLDHFGALVGIGGGTERDDEDKVPGIDNENFFKLSEGFLFLTSQSLI